MNFIKQISAIAISSAAIVLSIGSNAQAASFTNPNNGNTYFLTDSNTTWTAAQNEAAAAGGNLVSVNDASEQSWLMEVFGTNTPYWIGLNAETSTGAERDWEWASGESVSYFNWAPGEPGDGYYGANHGAQNGREIYVTMNWGSNGEWNDLPDSGPGLRGTRGIIEVAAAQSVPEPTTILGFIAFGTIAATRRKRK